MKNRQSTWFYKIRKCFFQSHLTTNKLFFFSKNPFYIHNKNDLFCGIHYIFITFTKSWLIWIIKNYRIQKIFYENLDNLSERKKNYFYQWGILSKDKISFWPFFLQLHSPCRWHKFRSQYICLYYSIKRKKYNNAGSFHFFHLKPYLL